MDLRKAFTGMRRRSLQCSRQGSFSFFPSGLSWATMHEPACLSYKMLTCAQVCCVNTVGQAWDHYHLPLLPIPSLLPLFATLQVAPSMHLAIFQQQSDAAFDLLRAAKKEDSTLFQDAEGGQLAR